MAKPRAQTVTAAVVLAAVWLFGVNSMFGEIWRTGYVAAARAIYSAHDAVLPVSRAPLLRRYTGVPGLDHLLALSTVPWANIADGSAPALSLYAVQFGGQLVPVFAAVMVEASRAGNAGGVLSWPVFWGYLMQIFGYAAVMPVYAALHLFGSPVALASLGRPRARATALRHPSRFRLRVLVPAFALGYFLPSLLMGWPVSSPALHQWLNGLWQGFPLYVVASQQLFARLVAPAQQGHGAILSRAYSWAFYTAAAVQLCTYAVILAAKATPGLFPSWAAEAFAFGAVFAPGPFHSSKPLSSMVAAMHDFYKWDQYVGSAAAITWAVCLDVSSQEAGVSLADWAILGWDVVRWSAIAGPAGALVRLLQRRDGRVLLEDTVVEDKRS